MMNRQIRRAQAKQEKKAERERDELRAARKRKVAQLRAKRSKRRTQLRAESGSRAGDTEGGAAVPEKTGARPGGKAGRFAGALMIVTVFFIVLQSIRPPDEGINDLLLSITGAGFFLLFGYFSVMWLMRRGLPQPLMTTWVTGGLLLVGFETAKALQGAVTFDPLMVALAVPGIVAGSYLGRLVYVNTPA